MTGGAAVGIQEEEQRRKKTLPWGDPVPLVHESETCLPSFMCCLLSDRTSVIHLHVESGMISWESFSCSRAGIMVLKSTKKILA